LAAPMGSGRPSLAASRCSIAAPDAPLGPRLRPPSHAVLLPFALAIGLLCSPLGAQEFASFPIPPGKLRPGALAATNDGNLWFSGRHLSGIGRMTPAGSITWFPLPWLNPDVTVEASGSDGSVWFTDDPRQAIGRVAPDGRIEEFPLPIKASPFWLVQGRDVQVWVGGGVHWRGAFVASFTVAEGFKVRTWAKWGQMDDGARAPDGSLWVTRPFDNILEQITPSGKTREFGAEAPDRVLVAPDGVVWYTSINRDCVTARRRDGSLRRIDLSMWVPDSLVVDRAGAIWLGGVGALVRVGQDGTTRTFPIPRPDSIISGLVNGPDGAIWFLGLRDHLDTMFRFTPPVEVTEGGDADHRSN
jgi:virginiamycin B lyase